MSCTKACLRLYAVTPDGWVAEPEKLLAAVRKALQGGVTFVQLREKTLESEKLITAAGQLKTLCHEFGVPLVLNDRLKEALASDVDGVHLGQGDMPAAEARRRLGPDKILGISAQTVAQALQAERDGADYLGVGAVFPTATKTDAVDVSHETLRAICQAVKIPVIAIGGITTENQHTLATTGIVGVAVVSAIFCQNDIQAAAAAFKRTLDG